MPSHSGHLALSAAIIIAGAMISGSIWWSDTQLLLEARQIAETATQLLPAARQIADASARISEVAQRAPPANSQAACRPWGCEMRLTLLPQGFNPAVNATTSQGAPAGAGPSHMPPPLRTTTRRSVESQA